MSIFKTHCPKCDAPLRVPADGEDERQVECPRCGYAFLATADGNEPPAKAGKVARGGRPGERPVARPARGAKRRYDEDDRSGSKGAGTWIVVAGVVAGVLMLVALGAVIYAVSGKPEAAEKSDPEPEARADKPAPGNAGPIPGPTPKPDTGVKPKAPDDEPPPDRAEAIPPDTVAAVKRATVYVRVQGGNWKATGSGFVVAADGDSVLVATNYHVVSSPEDDEKRLTPSELVKSFKRSAVTAVFDGGTRTETSAKAEVIAADPEYDLAILRVAGLKDPPTPIAYADPPKLSETMPIYTFGFPFGQALALGKGAPAVTVGKGSVSSLRLDDDGELALVQIDGALNPGNSGGPVVDARGRLVGVAVSRIKDGQGIGFAVPSAELGKMMAGRTGDLHMAVARSVGGKLTVKAEVGVIDPYAAVKGVALYYLVAPKGAKPKSGEPLETQAGARKIVLTLADGVASGELSLDAAECELFAQAVPDVASGISRVQNFSIVRKDGAVALGPTWPSAPGGVFAPPPIRPPPRPGGVPGVPGGTPFIPPPIRPVPPVIPGPIMPGLPGPPGRPPFNPPGRPPFNPPGKPPFGPPDKPPFNPPVGATVEPKDAGRGPRVQGRGDQEFRDATPPGGHLVGLEVGLGKWLNREDIVKAVRPVYRVGGKESLGAQYGTELTSVVKVVARPGYAVGAITLKTGICINGLSVTFMKLTDGKLDPKDSYESDWVGGEGGGGPERIGDGTPVVGLIGKARPDTVSDLGLLFPAKK